MKNKIKGLLGIMGFTVLYGCGGLEGGSAVGVSNEPANTDFYQHWVHSFEEQNGQKINHIFRPRGSREFPAGGFRMEFSFDSSGQCNYKVKSPVGAHQMHNCIFTKIGEKVYLYDMQGKLLSHLSFTVGSANKDRMIMNYGIKAPPSKKNAKHE